MNINARFSHTNAYYPPHNPAADTPASRTKRSVQPQAGGPYSPAALLNGFWQKWDSMNCVTVAGIKAAMQRFGGPNEVYFSVQRTYDGFDVRMRDNPNNIYHVTFDELAYAANSSGFSGYNQKILNEANFMYAVSAKRAQFENNNGYAAHSFADAVNSLNSWEFMEEGLNRLGLGNYVQHTNAQELINGAAGVIAKNNHVFTVLNGRADHYGTSGYTPYWGAPALKLR
jgi:hypothetical protein